MEARSLEINPLVLTKDGEFVAADCRLTIDDYAVARHPELKIEIARASIVFSFQQLEHPAKLLREGRDTRAVLRKKNWVSVHEKILCRAAS